MPITGEVTTESEKKLLQWFTAIAPNYGTSTANTTRDFVTDILDQYRLGINGSSVIHDNASGPGTATEAIIKWAGLRGHKPNITATDSTPAMIEEMRKIMEQHKDETAWRNVRAEVMHSADLKTIPDDTFTHVFCNFSMFAFGRPRRSLIEMHRTLRSGGIAVLTVWKRFPLVDIVAAAQTQIKGADWVKEHPTPAVGPEFLEEGYLAKMVEEAGWERGKIKAVEMSRLLKEGEDWDALYEFTVTKTRMMAVQGWSEDESEKWPEAVKAAMQKEKAQHGGVQFVAWVVLARKWDALCG